MMEFLKAQVLCVVEQQNNMKKLLIQLLLTILNLIPMMVPQKEIVPSFWMELNVPRKKFYGDALSLILPMLMLLWCVLTEEVLVVQTKILTSILTRMMVQFILLASNQVNRALTILNQFVVVLHSILKTRLLSLYFMQNGNKIRLPLLLQ